jgi:hypothetical protein
MEGERKIVRQRDEKQDIRKRKETKKNNETNK